jgi:hypothetical protein
LPELDSDLVHASVSVRALSTARTITEHTAGRRVRHGQVAGPDASEDDGHESRANEAYKRQVFSFVP